MSTASQPRVAAAVRAELARRRISQEAFAASVGKSASAIQRRLSGHVALTVDDLEQFANALQVDPRDLL